MDTTKVSPGYSFDISLFLKKLVILSLMVMSDCEANTRGSVKYKIYESVNLCSFDVLRISCSIFYLRDRSFL